MIDLSSAKAWLRKNNVKGVDGGPYPPVGKPLSLSLTSVVVGASKGTYTTVLKSVPVEPVSPGSTQAGPVSFTEAAVTAAASALHIKDYPAVGGVPDQR